MKRRIHTNIVILCGDLEIAIDEMYNVLFMNEPIALRQIGSLFKILPSEVTPVYGRNI